MPGLALQLVPVSGIVIPLWKNMDKTLQKHTLRIINIRHGADQDITLREVVADCLCMPQPGISHIKILRRATDARQKRLDIVYTVAVTVMADQAVLQRLLARPDISEHQEPELPVFIKARCGTRPIIIGSGPAGLFAALTLVERGIPPIIIERGERISSRAKTVDLFWKQGLVNPESNVLYGEGGAGTFSDGKLTTRTKSPHKELVFRTLVAMGADPAIAFDGKAHIGTDRLQKIIPALVDELQRRGADFLFETRVSDIAIEQGRVTGLTAGGRFFPAEAVFLATGHSSRDMYRMLHDRGAQIAPKGFAVGLRIEHEQRFIDTAMFGHWAQHPALGSADYFLSYKDGQSGRGVYSFCMCPGGFVIGCATHDGELCTNGMSTWSRDAGRANAALVVTLRDNDFVAEGPLGGIVFQERLEKAAFLAGGGNFFAPAQTAADFVSAACPSGDVRDKPCSYAPGIRTTDLGSLLPEFISAPLRRAICAFDKKMPGFMQEGLLIGIETRTSSPVRLVRSSRTYHSTTVRGLVPIGEGSGYAGGIVSSAVDGIQGALHFDT